MPDLPRREAGRGVFCGLPYPSADHVVGQPLPIRICRGKPLLLCGEVLGLLPR